MGFFKICIEEIYKERMELTKSMALAVRYATKADDNEFKGFMEEKREVEETKKDLILNI